MENHDDFELNSFHDLVSVAEKDSVISLKQKDLKQIFKMYVVRLFSLTCRKLGSSSVFIKLLEDGKAFDEIDAVRNQARKTRLIFATDGIVFVKEMPSPVHSRVTRFVERRIADSILHRITLDDDGQPRTLDLEVCGDGCKWPANVHRSCFV